MKYTIGLVNCEIDIEVSCVDELRAYTEYEKVLYITDEYGDDVFFDRARTEAAILND